MCEGMMSNGWVIVWVTVASVWAFVVGAVAGRKLSQQSEARR
jgi:hypothetical protein